MDWYDVARAPIMTHEELHRFARQQPFQPFRVVLTTGDTYDIRHPDLIMVGRRSAVLGLVKNPAATTYDLFFTVDLLHIVGVEELPPTPPPSANGPTS
jgi:hypothetical protein